jgi:hypothetical protein
VVLGAIQLGYPATVIESQSKERRGSLEIMRRARVAQNVLGECWIQPSVRKVLYFMLLRRNSSFQSGYSNLAHFKLRRPIPIDHSH